MNFGEKNMIFRLRVHFSFLCSFQLAHFIFQGLPVLNNRFWGFWSTFCICGAQVFRSVCERYEQSQIGICNVNFRFELAMFEAFQARYGEHHICAFISIVFEKCTTCTFRAFAWSNAEH